MEKHWINFLLFYNIYIIMSSHENYDEGIFKISNEKILKRASKERLKEFVLADHGGTINAVKTFNNFSTETIDVLKSNYVFFYIPSRHLSNLKDQKIYQNMVRYETSIDIIFGFKYTIRTIENYLLSRKNITYKGSIPLLDATQGTEEEKLQKKQQNILIKQQNDQIELLRDNEIVVQKLKRLENLYNNLTEVILMTVSSMYNEDLNKNKTVKEQLYEVFIDVVEKYIPLKNYFDNEVLKEYDADVLYDIFTKYV